jgi:regulator of sigma E protease
MPAAAAGLQAGDVLVGVNDKRSRNTADIVTWIRASNAQPVTLWIERKGKTISKTITPVYSVIPGSGRVPSIGIAFDQNALSKLTYTRVDTVTAVKAGFAQAARVSISILDMVSRAFTRNLSKEETQGIRGPVGIAQTVGESAQRSWSEVILTAGLLSVNLGLLNLLPFPALDGGRILFLAYEFVARRPFDPRKEGVVHMVGMAMLLAFMLFITFRDVVIGLKG